MTHRPHSKRSGGRTNCLLMVLTYRGRLMSTRKPSNESLAELIALLPDCERKAALAELAPTPAEMNRLEHSWDFWARQNQKTPPGDWFTWLILSGRGFGKTRVGAEWIIQRAKHGPYFPMALVGQSKADVRDTMVELGESSILKVSAPWFRPEYEPSKRRLTWPNGMVATIFSGDEPGQLRGPQHGSAWVDELAKFKYPKDTWDNLVFGCRLGSKPQIIATTTPRPIPIIKSWPPMTKTMLRLAAHSRTSPTCRNGSSGK